MTDALISYLYNFFGGVSHADDSAMEISCSVYYLGAVVRWAGFKTFSLAIAARPIKTKSKITRQPNDSNAIRKNEMRTFSHYY
jgi:hypothetical protein